ncbi:hypothetical protein [uncultured Mucilaginibacter sp.]|uniref:hypothetical protein n=1 Tax=uncultured Mucilaginibacter sp. TaxID=797541 RepID=UPI0025D798FE|nr:hypothetical protein [uncultured Mucilaginibacter sp.]
MKNLPFETMGLRAEEIQVLESTFVALANRYPSSSIKDRLVIPTEQFDCFNFYQKAEVVGEITVNGCYIILVNVSYIAVGDKYGDRHIDARQLWAVVKFKKDFGRILIRHETLADKITELIHPIELDFADDKPFSNKFYVVTNDKNKALLAMNWNFRNAVMDMPTDWMIEIVGNDLIIYSSRLIDPVGSVALAEFAGKIASLR